MFKELINYEYLNLKTSSAINTIIYAPEVDVNYKNYQNIFFLDTPICKGFINQIACFKNRVFVVNNKLVKSDLQTSRNIFAIYHNAIKSFINEKKDFIDLYDFFNTCKTKNPQIKLFNFEQFALVLSTLLDLKILKSVDSRFEFSGIKSDLKNSNLLNFYNNLKMNWSKENENG